MPALATKVSETPSQQKVWHRKVIGQVDLGKKQDLISKIIRTKELKLWLKWKSTCLSSKSP
jgi:hypothetical protein